MLQSPQSHEWVTDPIRSALGQHQNKMVDDVHKVETHAIRSQSFGPENRNRAKHPSLALRARAENAATNAPKCDKTRQKVPSGATGLLGLGAPHQRDTKNLISVCQAVTTCSPVTSTSKTGVNLVEQRSSSDLDQRVASAYGCYRSGLRI